MARSDGPAVAPFPIGGVVPSTAEDWAGGVPAGERSGWTLDQPFL